MIENISLKLMIQIAYNHTHNFSHIQYSVSGFVSNISKTNILCDYSNVS